MKTVTLVLAAAALGMAQSNPPRIDFITYLGSSSSGPYIAVDSAGNIFVAGSLSSSQQLPCAVASTNPPGSTPTYAFVSRLSPDGSAVVWTSCFADPVGAIAVDSAGTVHAATNSASGAAVVTLNPASGATMSYVFLASANIVGIAADSIGNTYVAGGAGIGFTTTPEAYRSTAANCAVGGASCVDGFAVKLNAAGVTQYATFLNTSSGPSAMAIDSKGAVWVTGSSLVVGTNDFDGISDFVVTDAFIVKLDPSGSQEPYQNFFGSGIVDGGETSAQGFALTVDANDNVYATGAASGGSLTVTPGTLALDPIEPLPFVGYVMKLDSSGNTIYLDAIGPMPESIAVDSAGNAYLNDFNQTAGDTRCANSGDSALGAIALLSADASKLLAYTALAGDVVNLATNGNGVVYLAGQTEATTFFATPGAFMTQYPGVPADFVAKLDFSQPAQPAIACLVNAASLFAGRNTSGSGFDGSVAPGEIVTLFGQGFPTEPGLSVTFDGKAAPILYSDAGQINAVVPFATGSSSPSTSVAISNGTQSLGPYVLPVSPAVPGLFTTSVNGTTQIAMFNQDSSLNSNTNPAPAGSIVSFYMTGAGAFTPSIADGSIGPLQPPFPTPAIGVSATIWGGTGGISGEPAQILFAGQAPGLIAGAVQINLRIPADIAPGAAYVAVYAGDYPTPAGTMFVGAAN